MQLKAECADRLVKRIYDFKGMDTKYWLAFGKRNFLGQKFNDKL
jgi:hypothetical protein